METAAVPQTTTPPPRSKVPLVSLAFLSALAALGQTTTNVDFDIVLTVGFDAGENLFIVAESGSVGSLGNASLLISATAPIQGNGFTTPVQIAGSLNFNALDSITFGFTSNDPNFFNNPVASLTSGTISGGTGAYAGASGSLNLTFGGSSLITGSGSVTVAGKTTALNLTNFHGSQGCPGCERDYSNATISGTVTPLGQVTGTLKIDNTQNNANSSAPSSGILTVALNSADSINLYLANANGTGSGTLPVAGGTGAYAGATGAFTANVTQIDATHFEVKGSGTITTAAPGAPIITSVKTAFGAPVIASNTWIQINGTNLVPSNTPSTGVDWSTAPDFANGMMPTKLGALDNVMINGKPGYIFFYCSAATNSSCATDQINVLTPLKDGLQGPVEVIVTRSGTPSSPFLVSKVALTPALPLFDTKGHVVARHLDFSLLGPASLYPGSSTPAKAGETIILVAFGMGASTNLSTIPEGSATQSGPLAFTPRCWISGAQAAVAAALISPGLFQMNVTIPAGTPSGDNPIVCVYPGFPFSPGGLIAVQ